MKIRELLSEEQLFDVVGGNCGITNPAGAVPGQIWAFHYGANGEMIEDTPRYYYRDMAEAAMYYNNNKSKGDAVVFADMLTNNIISLDPNHWD